MRAIAGLKEYPEVRAGVALRTRFDVDVEDAAGRMPFPLAALLILSLSAGLWLIIIWLGLVIRAAILHGI